MKTFNLFLFIIISSLLFSCNKNEELKLLPETIKPISDTFYSLIRNYDDIDDDSNNIILYYTALAFQEVAKDSNLLADIYGFLKSAEDSIKYLYELYNQFPEMEQIMQDKLEESGYWRKELRYNGIDYKVALRYHNPIISNENETPIIAIGTGFNDIDTTLEESDPCWIKSGNNFVEDALSWEEENSTTHPLLALVIHTNQEDSSEFSIGKIPSINYPILKPLYKNIFGNTYTLQIDNYQINYRYDPDHYSEYAFSWAVYQVINGNLVKYDNDDRAKLAKVYYKCIGSYWPLGFEAYNSYATPTYTKQVDYILAGVTFEFDNICSAKPVSFCTYVRYCKMKYSHEYYQRILLFFSDSYIFYATWNQNTGLFEGYNYVSPWKSSGVNIYGKGKVHIAMH
jgi:hypothetical protein